jgi:16S rRNA (guanine966-N2)-methyltransferase
MRVIAGEFRSRRLKSIPGLTTRPTPDRLRETLFDILESGGLLTDDFADAYAGTGAIGIEALSRGVRHAYFLERGRAALEVIRENLASLQLLSRATVLPGAVLKTLAQIRAGIVFADPPYSLQTEYNGVLDVLAAHPPRLAIVQHSIHLELPVARGPLQRTRLVKQGDNALSFFTAL